MWFTHSLDRIALESRCARFQHNMVTCSPPWVRYRNLRVGPDLAVVRGRPLGRFQDVRIWRFMDVSLHILRAMWQGTSAGRQTKMTEECVSPRSDESSDIR